MQSSLQHIIGCTENRLPVSLATYSVQAHGLWREPLAANANGRILASNTRNVDQGTVMYMAPEILVKDLQISAQVFSDLILADVWAL